MGKDKKPRKRRDPAETRPAEEEQVIERQTQEKAELVPPSRRPPTAVAADTVPVPPREPTRLPPQHRRPVLFHVVEALRHAVGAILDLADAAADAIAKGIERRA